MTTAVIVALVGAGSAILGGLLAAWATHSVEALRLRANLIEKADERKIVAIEQFMLAVNAWLDWLIYMEDQGWKGHLDELNLRVKTRDDAYRRLSLLASEPLLEWLGSIYNPMEYELKRSYVHQVRYGEEVDVQARQMRIEFSRLLHVDLLEQCRPEVSALRDPLGSGSRGNRPLRFRPSVRRRTAAAYAVDPERGR